MWDEYDVLVVGSANVDLTVRVDRRPGAGETVLGSELTETPGGKGANQAVAAARLGARTALLGRVGADGFGRVLLDGQRDAGVDVRHVIVDDQARTGTALIVVGPDGDNSIVVSAGANGALGEGDVAAAHGVFAAAAVVSVQWEIPLETVRAAVAAGLEAGARVVVNPSPVPEALPGDVLRAADPLVVNEHEARVLAGEAGRSGDVAGWADALRGAGARSVVVTLGGAGALVVDGAAEPVRVPGIEVAAVDTTGAGDAFTGALASRLARGDGLVAATGFATRVGAVSVTRAGAQPSFPGLVELGQQPEDRF